LTFFSPGHISFLEAGRMKVGDTVIFVDALYEEGEEARYRVVEIEDDRVLIEFICDLSFPPLSTAKISELEVVEEDN
jgi:hypothetical protein